MDEKKLVDKIKALLRLADSDNVHEAANAAGRAQKLMEAHNIDQAVLEVDDGETDEPIRSFEGEDSIHAADRLATWKRSLAWNVASANGCRTYTTHMWDRKRSKFIRTIGIVGRPSDVATVRYFFSYLAGEIDRLATKAGRGKGRTWLNSFRFGAVDEIRVRMKEAKEAARRDAKSKLGGNANALVKLDLALARLDDHIHAVDAWMKANMNLRSASSSSSRRDANGYQEGREAGRNINLGNSATAGLGAGKRALGPGKGR